MVVKKKYPIKGFNDNVNENITPEKTSWTSWVTNVHETKTNPFTGSVNEINVRDNASGDSTNAGWQRSNIINKPNNIWETTPDLNSAWLDSSTTLWDKPTIWSNWLPLSYADPEPVIDSTDIWLDEITEWVWWTKTDPTKIDWKTWYEDSNKDWVISPDELSWNYKDFYDGLSPAAQKEFLMTWQNAMSNNLDIAEAYKNYMEDYNTTEWRSQDDEDYRLKQEWISEAVANIQENQTIRRAEDNLNKLKQSIYYLGNMWMPWTSAQRVVSLENMLKEAKTSFNELNALQSYAKESRGLWQEKNAQAYERKMEDISTKLNRDVDTAIQSAYNSLTAADNNGKLDTVEELEDFRNQMYFDLDKSITWFSDASFEQIKFLNKEVTATIKERREYQANENTLDSEMSEIKWYYVNANGNKIIWADWQAINFVAEPPMKPIFDKDSNSIITFTNDEFGNIKATRQELEDEASYTSTTISDYVSLVADWKIILGDVPRNVRSNSSFLSQLNQTSFAWDITDGNWKEDSTWRLYNTKTWQYKDESWNISWADYNLIDWSTNKEMIDKYEWEASFKNNNPTWITFDASSNELKNLWTEAWIWFSKGSYRPLWEWWNYVKFDSVQDWMDAYTIALTQRWDNIFNRLTTWVWTWDQQNDEKYANDLMKSVWIEKWTRFSELDDNTLWLLMWAQLQKESPNFYNELVSLQDISSQEDSNSNDAKFEYANTLTASWRSDYLKREKLEDEYISYRANQATEWADFSDVMSMKDVIFPEKVTEFKTKSLWFWVRMDESEKQLRLMEEKYKDSWTMSETLSPRWDHWYIPNFIKTDDRLAFEQAQRNFVNSVLRQESWAAIADSEFKGAAKQYFVASWDTPEIMEQKRQNRITTTENMFRSSWKDEKWRNIIDIYNYIKWTWWQGSQQEQIKEKTSEDYFNNKDEEALYDKYYTPQW